MSIEYDRLAAALADGASDGGIRIDTALAPLGGPGSPVKPPIYEGGAYQHDKRWDESGGGPHDVIVVDAVQSQANRLEAALLGARAEIGLPEIVLDLSSIPNLPPHLPRSISSLLFPHRNADAYLRDSEIDGVSIRRTAIGHAIMDATATSCGPIAAWFPQALVFGFWQSHLGKKRSAAKHPRAWVSEIIGWQPAVAERATPSMGLKGDPLNLSIEERATVDDADQTTWAIAERGGVRLSELGHGQVPFMGEDAAPAPVSFRRVTQLSTLSFAQLRRLTLGGEPPEADAAVRALAAALALHAHELAFERPFELRSGADLTRESVSAIWRSAGGAEPLAVGGPEATAILLRDAIDGALAVGVDLDGWRRDPLIVTPSNSLADVIRKSWPDLTDGD
jgi:CRISPR-associated protein Csb1